MADTTTAAPAPAPETPAVTAYGGPGLAGAHVVGGHWGDDPPAWPDDDPPTHATTGAETRQEDGE